MSKSIITRYFQFFDRHDSAISTGLILGGGCIGASLMAYKINEDRQWYSHHTFERFAWTFFGSCAGMLGGAAVSLVSPVIVPGIIIGTVASVASTPPPKTSP